MLMKFRGHHSRSRKAYLFIHTYVAECGAIDSINSRMDVTDLVRSGKAVPVRTAIARLELGSGSVGDMLSTAYEHAVQGLTPFKIIRHGNLHRYLKRGVRSYHEGVCTEPGKKAFMHIFTIVIPGKKIVSALLTPSGWKILEAK